MGRRPFGVLLDAWRAVGESQGRRRIVRAEGKEGALVPPELTMKKTALASCLAAGFAAVLVLFWFDPSRVPIYPVCQFHKLTGLDCPGCGSLRALHELSRGHWMAAVHLNLFLVLSLPVFAWVGIRYVRREIKGEPAIIIRPFWLWLYLAAWLLFGVLRDLPIPLFASFAP